MSLQAVGIAQGVLGVFGAVSGVPAGYIADHTRRDRTLHGFGVVQIGAHNLVIQLLFDVPDKTANT